MHRSTLAILLMGVVVAAMAAESEKADHESKSDKHEPVDGAQELINVICANFPEECTKALENAGVHD